MSRYILDSDQIIRILEDTIDLFLKYQYQKGYEESGARAAAIRETMGEGIDNLNVEDRKAIGDESDFIYNSLAEILSVKGPIESPEEAFNSVSTMGGVLRFLKNIVGSLELGMKDRATVAEILDALETVCRRLMEWEQKTLGIESMVASGVKLIPQPAANPTKK